MIDKISQDLIDSIVEALYASDEIIVVSDGCSTQSRDKMILMKIVCKGIKLWQEQYRAK